MIRTFFRNTILALLGLSSEATQCTLFKKLQGNIIELPISKLNELTLVVFVTTGIAWVDIGRFCLKTGIDRDIGCFYTLLFHSLWRLNSISLKLFWENTRSDSENYQVFEILDHSCYFSVQPYFTSYLTIPLTLPCLISHYLTS